MPYYQIFEADQKSPEYKKSLRFHLGKGGAIAVLKSAPKYQSMTQWAHSPEELVKWAKKRRVNMVDFRELS